MNKHAKNLQTMLALLPKEVCHVYRDTIHDAVIEIEQLDSDAARYQWLRSRNLNSIDKGGIFAGQTPDKLRIAAFTKALGNPLLKERELYT